MPNDDHEQRIRSLEQDVPVIHSQLKDLSSYLKQHMEREEKEREADRKTAKQILEAISNLKDHVYSDRRNHGDQILKEVDKHYVDKVEYIEALNKLHTKVARFWWVAGGVPAVVAVMWAAFKLFEATQ